MNIPNAWNVLLAAALLWLSGFVGWMAVTETGWLSWPAALSAAMATTGIAIVVAALREAEDTAADFGGS